jgi:hypothetical protein
VVGVLTLHTGVVTTGEDLLEEFRRRRRGGAPRITSEGREILNRLVMGDLADDFAEALAETSASDPLLGCWTEPDR